ncbi:MAG TPA: hypothetical protein VFM65_05735 [Flavobacteriaceae bacterium]|nr:hypothetical protein [Flavobacteriaceae bacterium]
MKNPFNNFLAMTCLICFMAFGSLQAQQTRNYEIIQHDIGGGYSENYSVVVLFDATFEGFATQLKIHDVRLYILDGPDDFVKAAESKGVEKTYIPGYGKYGYPISKFDLYIDGTAGLDNNKSYSSTHEKEFTVQVSHALGDFTTLEFSEAAKRDYDNIKNVWEESGWIVTADYKTQITEMYLRDFDIRVKQ